LRFGAAEMLSLWTAFIAAQGLCEVNGTESSPGVHTVC
jgi:hypothetical protein